MKCLNSYILLVLGLSTFLKNNVTAEPLRNCSLINLEKFILYIYDLSYGLKMADYRSVADLETKTVRQFLADLQGTQQYSAFSSQAAWVKVTSQNEEGEPFSNVSLDTPLCEVIDASRNGNSTQVQYVLYVGKYSISLQNLTKRFMKGLIYDKQTSFFKLGALSPITLDKNFQPKQLFPANMIYLTQRKIASTNASNTFEFKNFLAVISSIIIPKQSEKYLNDIIMGYGVVSLMNVKSELLIDENQIELNSDFRDKLYEAANKNNLTNVERAMEIIEVLNNFGWYVTNHFVLGGRFDVSVKLIKKRNSAVSQYEILKTIEMKIDNQWRGNNTQFTKKENVTTTLDGAKDMQSYKDNLDDQQKWKIISLKNTIPSCKFLFKNDAHLMGEIRRLIITHAHLPNIKKLQPNVNMVQYVNDLWSKYIKPF
ncbi:uncharacterized protein LOC111518594 [Drosophila willistoni]|uniref:uncharacterized protein LOC111518594 n=1 Tax=Drosophila willistoni TaxID=7260 RepID=UPI001F07A256|nr:uncharacterized protein LOC111518594 [Drosophila willistoni]